MILNPKQVELIELLANEIEARYPDIKFVEAVASPDGENTLWLEFTKPVDDDRMLDVIEFGSNRAMDILEEYGYHFLIMPVVDSNDVAADST